MKRTKEDLIRYRMNRSAETLRTARMLLEIQDWYGAANRLYYGAFYIVTALMTQDDVRVKSHAGVKHMLDFHFVKTGRLPL